MRNLHSRDASQLQECLVFDLYGDSGHFKKFYTTSSPLTFDIPPKTCLTGIIGAIIGLSYEERYELFEAKVGIRLLSEIRKKGFGIDWLNTKARSPRNLPATMKVWLQSLGLPPKPEIAAFTGLEWPGQSPHTQATVEVLLNPSYRIYYPESNPRFDDLLQMIKDHKSYYTPFLGSSEFIANFKFIDLAKMVLVTSPSEFIEIHSIVPSNALDTTQRDYIDLNNKMIEIANMPNTMKPERVVLEYINVLYNPKAESLLVKPEKFYRIVYNDGKTENILFI